ncbi:MAG: trypsin-like peptidase domain-containing protein [Bacteroidota bacterium]
MPTAFSSLVLQIATPFSTGTGFYFPQANLIVTNEHVVRDNPSVLVSSEFLERRLVPVVYLDPYYDLAFLEPDEALFEADLKLQTDLPPVGSTVVAIGIKKGTPQLSQEGEVLANTHTYHDIDFIQHTARLDAVQSGGPLFNAKGELLGINMYDIDEGHKLALTLPTATLLRCLMEFSAGQGRTATRCFDCQELNFEPLRGQHNHCRNCGAPITLPVDVKDYQPDGIQATIEQIIAQANFDPRLARRGPNLWGINQGSARIQLAYHEDSGLVTGDAHLCLIPEDRPATIFEYLLRQNYELEQLTFSTHGREVILSLLIYDRYLTAESGLPQFQHLFERADFYDNYLVEEFGASWE